MWTVVLENDIFTNRKHAIAIGGGASPRVAGNTIRDAVGGALCLAAHSRARVAANVIYEHPDAAGASLEVPEAILASLLAQNQVHRASENAAGPAPEVV